MDLLADVALPALVGIAIGVATAPAGVSGAVFVVPVLIVGWGLAPMVAAATALLYNVLAIPSGLARLVRRQRMDWRLSRLVIPGSIVGVLVGVLVRVQLPATGPVPAAIAVLVLATFGTLLLLRTTRIAARDRPVPARGELVGASTLASGVGGTYGVGGGAFLAPYLALRGGDPAAAAASMLLMTWLSSIVGGAAYLAVSLGIGIDAQPQFLLAAALGIGGAVGIWIGARLTVPEVVLRRLLGLVALAAAARLAVDVAA